MLPVPLDEGYFLWLYSHIASPKEQRKRFQWWELAKILYTTPFEWFIPNDDNRAVDGTDLRDIFMHYEEPYDETFELWVTEECTMLEMLIALADRLKFEVDAPIDTCFWMLMDNIGLTESRYNDSAFSRSPRKFRSEVDEVLSMVNNRTYDYDGNGGLFPLTNPQEDQREVEIWYQMAAYLNEKEGLY